MRIAIIGAGIAGVCTAYELAADGHQVSVFERRGSVAAEASFANSGLVAPGLVLGWTQAPLSLAGRWRRWRQGRDEAAALRRQRLLKLAVYSHERLQQLRRSLKLDYERAEGMLVLLRSAREQAAIAPGLELLAEAGIAHRALDAAQCRQAEPGLNPEAALHGGVLLNAGEVGNCRQFAHQLRLEAQRLGVQFRFHTTVRSIAPGTPARLVHEYTPPHEGPGPSARNGNGENGGDTQPAETGPQQDSFEAIIVCGAQDSAALLQPLKLKLPLASAQSCSITAPLRQLEAHPELGPKAGLFDQQKQVHISRIGQRVRVVGSDEAQLHKVLNDWLPGAMVAGQLQRWQGPHATLSDGLPVLGGSGLAGIWLNLGHADGGFTLACGAARVLAEQVGGLTPELDVSGLDSARFG
ncbi:FAD-dependent oxidoreductase [Roseateles violae]|uniref:FAD-dependent oxidoreductase n=1 Tax=Roseateles violae TaxID=3058042 RepID=A0ABT8DZQ7_9BURK|nr:FAD-dependent oxidoreductase [Pelomonas sp. PFR6]MDN3923039.1 FAD-dependent oxidoreductase [Pelomonas sp. PFR6]